MKTVIPFLFAIVSILNFNHNVKADQMPTASDEAQASQVAIDARNDVVHALVHGDFVEVAHNGFDHAIRDLADQLRNEQNAPDAADELIQKWESDQMNFEGNLFAMSFNDLGDHAPLFSWLETYFTKLEDKYGSIVTRLPIIQNIRMLNFAIPVVFHPKGNWEVAGVDNRIEYRKHFIPFANLITYYSSLYACNYFTVKSAQPKLKKLCKMAANKLEFVMGRYIAAPISDFIYKASHRSGVRQIKISSSQLKYENGDDLANDIRQGLMLQ